MGKCFLLAAVLLLSGCARPGALIAGVAAGAALLISANKGDSGDDSRPLGQQCHWIIRSDGSSTQVCQ